MVTTMNGFPSEITAAKSLGQTFTLPVIEHATDGSTLACNSFSYSIVSTNPSDVDLLLSVDETAG